MKEESYHIDETLLVKYLLEESSLEEKTAVEQWIHAHTDNRKYYDDFKLIWEESKQFASTSTIDVTASWQRFRNRIRESETEETKVKSISTFYWLKVAAMIILIGGAAVLTIPVFKGAPEILVVESHNRIVPDTLPDGSIVTLNKNSVLSYPGKFKGDNRSISLQGEAFFEVTPDKSKPFIITVNDITVRVVGTSFNIKSTNGNTEVIVTTGIVEVIKKDKSIVLHPDDKLVIKNADSVLQKEKQTDQLYNYYRTREFKCDNTPLWKLVEVLNQAYDAKIIIENNKLRNLPLTTTFNNESLDNILEVIRETFKISVIKSGDTIILQ